ncbi:MULTISPECIES: hypothetical protein [Staphylococcus]|uniref:hypothetical protein n=1 Tax=Staphylococcus TaxID=1279 RepID=UPI0006466F23|nr:MULTISPECIES: hypothetical protein [Staphylococcus]ATH60657.1 hypothetical protein BJD96_10280 [Staphylococcus nepalensis]ATH65703.1 hypothetical protein BJG89_10375 [Staphylococcus nepalensis]NWN86374.1 hypothetical protein [Staphylococcus sp.]
MLMNYEYEFQLSDFNLNNLSLKKYNEEFLSYNNPYTIKSEEINFKVYLIEEKNNNITVLAKFTISTKDFKLNIEYIAEYNSTINEIDTKQEYYSKLEPAVFITMYQYAKEMSVKVISEVVGNKVIFPIYDRRKIGK